MRFICEHIARIGQTTNKTIKAKKMTDRKKLFYTNSKITLRRLDNAIGSKKFARVLCEKIVIVEANTMAVMKYAFPFIL